MEFISDDYQHPYLHHRNVLNPYTSAYAHPDYLSQEDEFIENEGPEGEGPCPSGRCQDDEDEESGQAFMNAIMDEAEAEDEEYEEGIYIDEDYNGPVSPNLSYNQRGHHKDEDREEEMSSYTTRRSSDPQGEDYTVEHDDQRQQHEYPEHLSLSHLKDQPGDDYNPKTDGKRGGGAVPSLEDKLTTRLEKIKSIFTKRLIKVSEFCGWNCFFSLLFVVGVLLVFLDHYGSAYVRMMNMQKFFFFVMGVLTTTTAVVVVCVVVAFTSCYGDGF